MQKLLDVFRLMRLANCLLAMVGVAIGARMAWLTPAYYGPFVAALAAFFVCAGGNVVNDIVDVDVDRVNHPDRVLVRGRLSVSFALWMSVVLNVLALICAIAVNWVVTFAVAGGIGLLVVYNLRLKKIMLVGNLVVALLAGLTFMTGGWAADAVLTMALPGPLIPAVYALCFHLVREILKDVQDIEGDRRAGYTSLPIRIGTSPSLMIALLVFAVLLVLTLIPVWMRWFGRTYEIIAVYVTGLPLLALLIFVWGSPRPSMLRVGSAALKVGMVLGLVALAAA
ncbi:MAG TPA: UbiA family prenyltransferase [Acidobacteriota bacterium]|nr:UbiA family prenyltransferase [Acidobacteriota bacterium]